jgi:hypothetical protein
MEKEVTVVVVYLLKESRLEGISVLEKYACNSVQATFIYCKTLTYEK